MLHPSHPREGGWSDTPVAPLPAGFRPQSGEQLASQILLHLPTWPEGDWGEWPPTGHYAQNIAPGFSTMHASLSSAMPLARPSSWDISGSSCSIEIT